MPYWARLIEKRQQLLLGRLQLFPIGRMDLCRLVQLPKIQFAVPYDLKHLCGGAFFFACFLFVSINLTVRCVSVGCTRGLPDLPPRRHIWLKPMPRFAFRVVDETQHGMGGEVWRKSACGKSHFLQGVAFLVRSVANARKFAATRKPLPCIALRKTLRRGGFFRGAVRACARCTQGGVRYYTPHTPHTPVTY